MICGCRDSTQEGVSYIGPVKSAMQLRHCAAVRVNPNAIERDLVVVCRYDMSS